MKTNKRCGIVTFHHSHNYGSVLQSYALAKVIQSLGVDAEIIDFRHPCTTYMYEWKGWSPYRKWRGNIKYYISRGVFKWGKKRQEAFIHFIENKLPLSPRITDRNDIPDIYDVLVCGSDQIWNYKASGLADPIYFLDFAYGRPKFSYAASSGGTPFAEKCHDRMLNYLRDFMSIGVREQYMKKYICKEFSLNAVVNPDPTLFLSYNNWKAIEEVYHNLPECYVLVYTLEYRYQCLSFANKVAKELKLPLVHIIANVDINIKRLLKKTSDYPLSDVSPGQFLWLFRHATYVVTNTFHGNVFSIIFQRNFITWYPSHLDSRILTLHNMLEWSTDRMCYTINDFRNIQKEIDYTDVEEKIERFKQEGLDFLKTNLLKSSSKN